MDMQAALRARITGASTPAGQRVYWVDRPQASALPAVTLQVVNEPRSQHLKGFNPTQQDSVQIDCWASTYGTAKALKEAVLAAVVPEQTGNGVEFCRAIIERSGEAVEKLGTELIHRARIDLTVTWMTA